MKERSQEKSCDLLKTVKLDENGNVVVEYTYTDRIISIPKQVCIT